MATRKYEARKYERNQIEATQDTLTVEEALQIVINGEPFTITMRTPGDDPELVRGILHSEGVILDKDYHPDLILNKDDDSILTEVQLTIPSEKLGNSYNNSRSLLSVSSCGICGKTELEDIKTLGNKIEETSHSDIDTLHQLFDKMGELQYNFHKSGGTHAAVAFNSKGEILCALEDIGRHNAVDKVVGKLLISSRLKEASYLTVSGRISYEIIVKCFKAGIPILAAVSAPSSLAVDYAKELGITLFAFCRNGRATCYSNTQRIKTIKQLSTAS
ncbi:MAG: formate dehydrogenase accessory sulfurtransferase FdhD [Flavobacteriales bacterium]|nr:formate dehydrogenase accessory sulfurtransferase FdhD [Flavobacteriales bacterium]